jgi:hypothetical protein
MHLPEAWTKVLLVRTDGLGLANGGIYWDVPRAKIPEHPRNIGTVFLLETPLAGNSATWMDNAVESHARRFEDLVITELPAEDASKYQGREGRY